MMSSLWNSEKFPQFEAAVRGLIAQHLELQGETLHLAMSFAPPRDRDDVFLLEVIGGPLAQSMSDDGELFEVSFLSSSGFPLKDGQELHLILTSPDELKTALEDDWKSAREIVEAIRKGDYRVLHADDVGNQLVRQLEFCARHAVGVGHE